MSFFGRTARMLAATALVTATATIALSSPASAAPTASLTDNGDGSITFTYSGVTANDYVNLLAMPAGADCAQAGPANAEFFLVTDPNAAAEVQAAASPAIIIVGTAAFKIAGGGGSINVVAGQYRFCLQGYATPGPVISQLQQLDASIGVVAPTTTTTSTTTAAADPVSPAFTG